jgi:glycosyltransferase involved in cell wall biosynthesis
VYRERLRADGVEVRFKSRRVPLLSWLAERVPTGLLFRPVRLAVIAARRLALRWLEIRLGQISAGYHVIFVLKTGSLPMMQRLRRNSKARLIYDLNDGLWLPGRRAHTNGNLNAILRTADVVTGDNEPVCEYARRHNKSVCRIPDHPPLESFERRRNQIHRDPSKVVLGWIGSPGTAFNLFSIWEPLERLFEAFPQLELRILGASGPNWLPKFEKVRYTTCPSYSEASMVDEALAMDIGLFPLFDVEDSRARGVLKATVYMSAGACVVTRLIGDTRTLIQDGVNGVFAETPGEWFSVLSALIADPDRRKRIAEAGTETMRRDYSLDACYGHFRTALFGDVPSPDAAESVLRPWN